MRKKPETSCYLDYGGKESFKDSYMEVFHCICKGRWVRIRYLTWTAKGPTPNDGLILNMSR